MQNGKDISGFTLIELSIVLVIIGLIVGAILAGKDLIDAAAQRAQIAQIEKYNTAVHTFQGKYGYLPGDIPAPYASNFGFIARGTNPGEGDGNGVIEGNCTNAASGGNNGFDEGCGELALFWTDLTTANLIDTGISQQGGFPNATSNSYTNTPSQRIPNAKIGNGNFVYIWSAFGNNYFGLSSVYDVNLSVEIFSSNLTGVTVQQAYNIDKKIDDGLPQSGSVMADYVNYHINGHAIVWSSGAGTQGANNNSWPLYGPTTNVTSYATTNCYDNSYAGGSAAIQNYQLQNATAQNCALSFKFQ